MKHKIVKRSLFLILLAYLQSSFATQYIPVEDNATVTARISSQGFNSISIKGDRIQSVRAVGKFEKDFDNINGIIFIKPQQTEPIYLYLTTESQHLYQVRLNVMQGQIDSVVLEPPLKKKENTFEEDSSHQTLLVHLMRAMVSGQFDEDYRIVDIQSRNPLPLGQVATITKVKEYEGADVVGEIYILTNLTNKELDLKPEQLFQPNALAIALRNQAIPAGGQTQLFMIKQES